MSKNASYVHAALKLKHCVSFSSCVILFWCLSCDLHECSRRSSRSNQGADPPERSSVARHVDQVTLAISVLMVFKSITQSLVSFLRVK